MRQVTDGSNYKHGATGPRTRDHFGGGGEGAKAGDIDGKGAVSNKGKRFIETAHAASGPPGTDEDAATYGNVMPDSPMEEAHESKKERAREAAAGDSD